MIRERVFSVLSSDVALSASTKAIRPLKLNKKDKLPAITYQVEIDHDKTYDGNTAMKKATLETNIYATSLDTAISINTELKAAIVNVAGVATGITVYNIYKIREIEDFESEENEFRINTQFIINYKEG